jgi:hypothetical protein
MFLLFGFTIVKAACLTKKESRVTQDSDSRCHPLLLHRFTSSPLSSGP